MGPGLRDAPNTHIYSPEMTAMSCDVTAILRATDSANLLLAPAGSEIYWVSKKKSQAQFHRLLSLNSPGSEESVQRILPIMLSCMSMSTIWRSGKVNISKLACRLQRSTAQCEESVRNPNLCMWGLYYACFSFERLRRPTKMVPQSRSKSCEDIEDRYVC